MSCGCGSSSNLVGTIPTITFTFTDIDGAAADPALLDVRVMDPSGDVTAYTMASPEVDNPAVGTWTWRPSDGLLEAGTWWVYAAAGGGGVDVATEVSFSISDAHVPLAP